MKNNLFKLIALLALASMVLSGCGGVAATQAPAEKAKVTIFVGFVTGTDPDQVAAQEALANKFNDTHENIEM
jgi:ABC-type glycerol-3-phosphate transport system substrate-binding protein